MYSQIMSGAVCGLEIIPIEVQTDVSDGFPSYTTVGFAASELKESRERVTTALRNSGYRIPAKRIVVNLSPADIKKQGTSFDLPIAVSILMSLGFISCENIDDYLMLGELALNGRIMPVRGILPVVDMAKRIGKKYCIVPKANIKEAALVQGIICFGADRLKDISLHFNEIKLLSPEPITEVDTYDSEYSMDFSDIRGQIFLKRAMEIAAAGKHSILMVGPPGSGKTMAADRLITIMPHMTHEECLEVTNIYSINGIMEPGEILKTKRPVRKIHSSVTRGALVGGGSRLCCGEASLAHRGIMFLDELSDFSPYATDSLLKPMEDRRIYLSRYGRRSEFPADFLLVAAINPCKCGYYPDDKCTCTDSDIQSFQKKLSGPFMDRIDMSVFVEKIDFAKEHNEERSLSAAMKERVEAARNIQKERFGTNMHCNSDMNKEELTEYCRISDKDRLFMQSAAIKMGLSARGYVKVLKLARTIADLDSETMISTNHISEALCYRGITKAFWRRNPW